jgi:hypothetical protein
MAKLTNAQKKARAAKAAATRAANKAAAEAAAQPKDVEVTTAPAETQEQTNEEAAKAAVMAQAGVAAPETPTTAPADDTEEGVDEDALDPNKPVDSTWAEIMDKDQPEITSQDLISNPNILEERKAALGLPKKGNGKLLTRNVFHKQEQINAGTDVSKHPEFDILKEYC